MKAALIGLAAVTVAYVGAYVALLKPEKYYFCGLGAQALLGQRVVNYRRGGRVAEAVFQPLVRLDMKVRPGYWSVVEPLPGTPSAAGAAGFGGSMPEWTAPAGTAASPSAAR